MLVGVGWGDCRGSRTVLMEKMNFNTDTTKFPTSCTGSLDYNDPSELLSNCGPLYVAPVSLS